MDSMKDLLKKYKKGKMTAQDITRLEEFIATGKLGIEDFEDLQEVNLLLDTELQVLPNVSMDVRFYQSLGSIEGEQTRGIKWLLNPWFLGLAASLLVLLGFSLGRWGAPDSNTRIDSADMESIENRMVHMFHESSTSDRLNAALQMAELPQLSPKLVDALLFAVNFDKNSNVRMASIEALAMYGDDARVREGLVQSLKNQDSPLVLLSLAEVLYTTGEKQVLENFRSQLSPEIPAYIADQIDERIQTLY